MGQVQHQQPAADYRLRLPRSVRYAIAAGGAASALGVLARAGGHTNTLVTTSLIGVGALTLAPALALVGFVSVLQTARNHLCDTLADPLNWRGDETVLDVGTGSGILLFACAKQLITGSATGIDIYDPNAGGGSAETFWRNAHAEGVANRVELRTVDARTMAFPDASFDLVVSSLAMHHMGGADDRRRTTEEIMRVLKPGGKIAIMDLAPVIGDCEQALQQGHLINVRRDGYRHLFSILTAEKPRHERTDTDDAQRVARSSSF